VTKYNSRNRNRLTDSKYIGRLSADWILIKVTESNQETFLSTHPMDWHKTVSPWLPTTIITICPFNPYVAVVRT